MKEYVKALSKLRNRFRRGIGEPQNWVIIYPEEFTPISEELMRLQSVAHEQQKALAEGIKIIAEIKAAVIEHRNEALRYDIGSHKYEQKLWEVLSNEDKG